MKTEELSKLLIFGSNADKAEIISRLQHLGVMHIAKARPDAALGQDSPASDVDIMSHLLLKLQYIATQTNIATQFTLEGLPPKAKVIEQAEEFIEKHLTKIEELSKEKKRVLKEKSKVAAQKRIIESLPFALKKQGLKGHLRIILQSTEDLSKYPFPVKVKIEQSAKAGKKYFTELSVMNKDLGKFNTSLRKSRSRQLNIPDMPLGSAHFLKQIERQSQELEKKINNFISTKIEWISLNDVEIKNEKSDELINFFDKPKSKNIADTDSSDSMDSESDESSHKVAI